MSHRRGGQRLCAPRWPSPRPVPFLKRCSSAPSRLFLKAVRGGGEGDGRSFDEGKVLFRGHTCMDVLAPWSSSLRGSEGYSKDAKVVVNVTVEGIPGPARTMARLGCSVEDAIVAVVNRYGQEGWTPRLDQSAMPTGKKEQITSKGGTHTRAAGGTANSSIQEVSKLHNIHHES